MGIPVALGTLFFILDLSREKQLENTTEQVMEVEIASKRIYVSNGTSGANYYYYYYYASFKFADGSIKEFLVGREEKLKKSKIKPYCVVYESLNEGDTGIFTYKELKNAEKRGHPQPYRQFISFEKET